MHNPWLGMKGGPKTKEEFKRNWAVRQNHHASSGCFDFMKKWKAWCFSGSDAMGRSELGEDDLLSLWSLSAVKVGQCSFLRWVGQEAWGDWGEMKKSITILWYTIHRHNHFHNTGNKYPTLLCHQQNHIFQVTTYSLHPGVARFSMIWYSDILCFTEFCKIVIAWFSSVNGGAIATDLGRHLEDSYGQLASQIMAFARFPSSIITIQTTNRKT